MSTYLQGSFVVVGHSGLPEQMDLTGVQWIYAGQAATARMHICQLLQQSVKVWWPDDRRYYQGTVAEYMLDKVGMQSLWRQVTALWASKTAASTLLLGQFYIPAHLTQHKTHVLHYGQSPQSVVFILYTDFVPA